MHLHIRYILLPATRSIILLPVWGCLLILTLIMTQQATAQNPSRKHLGDKHQDYYDSLTKMNYDRVFPLLGTKVYKRGFDIPWPIGIMFNTFYANQGINISDIRVGIQGADTTLGPVDLSQVVQFGDVKAKGLTLNMRADLYVLPFLNVYAMLSYLPKASTDVTLVKPVQLSTNATQQGWAYGFGIMGAGGVGPVWIQADYNVNWADMQLLDNKVFTQIVGIRVGHVFPLQGSPEKNISLWVGMMGLFINNDTKGQIKLADVFPDISQDKINEIKNSYDQWYNGLRPVQQKVVDKIVEKLQDKIDGHPIDDVSINYEMNKAVKSRWAGLVGAQYQFNKRWQLRTECNLISQDRFSLMLSINYRFLGFKKNINHTNRSPD
ncbi:hypothetical protein [Paraflavitalea pollutisoli]|uniref:hypothetical protein n=1 Tax=Paraflavitalea pollutisoli TaxID=3034143 RepID=UPI0023EAFEAE|nr:hypothetical protein [Paraflavitalea sp. H1-2-19X]